MVKVEGEETTTETVTREEWQTTPNGDRIGENSVRTGDPMESTEALDAVTNDAFLFLGQLGLYGGNDNFRIGAYVNLGATSGTPDGENQWLPVVGGGLNIGGRW